MTGATMAGKLVKLTYIHPQKCNATLFEATLALDSHNRVTAKYSFASEHGHVKYTYLHGRGTTLEPSYDFQSQSWHFGIGHKFGKHDHEKLFMMATTRIWAWNVLGNQRNMVTSGYE